MPDNTFNTLYHGACEPTRVLWFVPCTPQPCTSASCGLQCSKKTKCRLPRCVILLAPAPSAPPALFPKEEGFWSRVGPHTLHVLPWSNAIDGAGQSSTERSRTQHRTANTTGGTTTNTLQPISTVLETPQHDMTCVHVQHPYQQSREQAAAPKDVT